MILIVTDPKIVEDIEGAISGCHQHYLTSTDLDQLVLSWTQGLEAPVVKG